MDTIEPIGKNTNMNHYYQSVNSMSTITRDKISAITKAAISGDINASAHYGDFSITSPTDMQDLSKYSEIKGDLRVSWVDWSGIDHLDFGKDLTRIDGNLIIKNNQILTQLTMQKVTITGDCTITGNGQLTHLNFDQVTIIGRLSINNNAPKVTHNWERVHAKGGMRVS